MVVEQHPHFLLVGPVGSGISVTLKAFQSLGYTVIGNAQPNAVERLLMTADIDANQPVAIHAGFDPYDVSPEQAGAIVEQFKTKADNVKVLYLSTPTDVLIQRFKEQEKPHPFEQSDGLRTAIEREQAVYQALKPLADYHINTSNTTEAEIPNKLARILDLPLEPMPMAIHVMSFGFKYGVPTEAEFVIDVRFIPNPFYEASLRPLSGLDQPVRDFVFERPEASEFMEHWQQLLKHTLQSYQAQGKTRVTIGIGCTGGQHRSVAIAQETAAYLNQVFPSFPIQVTHREQQHWSQQPSTATR